MSNVLIDQLLKAAARLVLLGLLCVGLLAAPLRAAEVAGSAGGLLRGFKVVVPPDPVDCQRADPWSAGEGVLAEGGFVPSGGCLSLRFALNSSAFVYLLHEDPSGRLRRLLPAGCDGAEAAVLEPGEQVFPAALNGRDRVLKLDTQAGVERLYLLAWGATPPSAVQGFLAAVAAAGGGCELAPDDSPQPQQLRRLIREQGVMLEWRYFEFNHY